MIRNDGPSLASRSPAARYAQAIIPGSLRTPE